MNLRINFVKSFMFWLTLQKYYTKFIVCKTIMLEVIFEHDFLNNNIYFPTFYTIKEDYYLKIQEVEENNVELKF